MSTLKSLGITENVSEAVQLNGKEIAVMVTTAASSTVTLESSIDGTNFSTVPDLSWTINGSQTVNVTDFVPGQFVRVKSTAEMTVCKILY